VDPLADAWEAQADAWTRWVRAAGGDPWHALFNWPSFASLLPPPGALTVDLGCGEGRVGRWLQLRGHRVLGVDAAPTMAARARETGAYAGVHAVAADAIPLPDGAADLVVAYMSLHDMDALDPALAEVARILRPGGRLCAAVVHPFASAAAAGGPYAREVRYSEAHADASLGIVFHGMHRPLSAYVRSLVAAGMHIEDLREPVPTADAVAAHPSLAKALDRPPFLHLRARR
jgi:SAM-dependent methyltransferase